MQTAYMGRALYYFKNDANPGDMNGQGYNGVWYVALVSGSVPTATPIPAATTMAPTVMTTTQGPVSSGGY